jgi:hypothetical protein
VRNLDVEIDAIQQRPGDAREITLHLNVSAAAGFLRIAVVPAGATPIFIG